MNQASEPCRFLVTVSAVGPGGCRADHRVGDHFAFAYCTPDGLCGEAFHAMYPLLAALRLGANPPSPNVGRGDGGEGEFIEFPCPDRGAVTFEVRRLEMIRSQGTKDR